MFCNPFSLNTSLGSSKSILLDDNILSKSFLPSSYNKRYAEFSSFIPYKGHVFLRLHFHYNYHYHYHWQNYH